MDLTSIIITISTSVITGVLTYFTTLRKMKSEHVLQEKTHEDEHTLKEREMLFSEYRNLINTAKLIITELKEEIKQLNEEISQARQESQEETARKDAIIEKLLVENKHLLEQQTSVKA